MVNQSGGSQFSAHARPSVPGHSSGEDWSVSGSMLIGMVGVGTLIIG